ncbi:MAG: response regulator [Clostridiales bacterium]|nr:response regulator [Clostridiales bacterium]
MRQEYKIIWIEDEPDEIDVHIKLVEDVVTSRCLKLVGADKIYTSIKSFEKEILEKYSAEDFSDFDLILVDFNLSHSKLNGKDLIKIIREKGIFTDILFYSGNIEELKKSLMPAELDGVVFSDNSREEFIRKFTYIIEKQINLKMRISSIRGYLMDSTSDFDFIIKNYTISFFENLDEVDQKKVIYQIKNFIGEQNENEQSKFKDVNKKTGINLIKAAMDSQEYVMSVRNKFYIFSLIYSLINKKELKFVEESTNNYDKNIIKPRNKLAHAKLLYGQRYKNHIKISKTIADLNCNCDNCREKYTKEECDDIRKNIYETYNYLDEIYKTLK